MRRKRIPSWKDYFTLSARERRGTYALIILIALQITAIRILRIIPEDDSIQHDDELLAAVRMMKLADTLTSTVIEDVKPVKQQKLFAFDPNTISSAQWQELGLSDKQAAVIERFLSKGGRFRTKADVQKMYCISNEMFDRLKSYILLPDSFESQKRVFSMTKNVEGTRKVNLNTADSATLVSLKGIGPAFAGRIVRFRDRLGGFHSVEQLKEVYGVTDSLYEVLLTQLDDSPLEIQRSIDINRTSKEELSSHPYISRQLAELIVNYREQHGPFQSTDQLLRLPLVTDEIFRKLAPYLGAKESMLP